MGASSRIVHAPAVRSATTLAAELAQRHFGAIARWQLLQLGCSRSQIAHWAKVGRLYRRYPGVYAWGRPDLPTEGELAAGLLLAGHGSALGGLSCLWWLELLGRRPTLIHIDAPGRISSRQDLRSAIRARSSEPSTAACRSSPCPQALLASAPHLLHDTLRLVLARAEFHHLLNLPSLQTSLGGEGRPGSIALRRAIDAHLPQLAACANDFERDFVLLCERFGLPIPEPNPRIGRYRPDMLWREARLIVELDGEDAHSSPAQKIADERRQAYLEQLGYVVIRFRWEDIEFRPEWVAGQVRAALACR